MNDRAVEQIRQQLVQLKLELQAQEKEYQGSSQAVELDQTRVGRLTRMDAMQAQQMALESSRRRQRNMQKIEGALRRLQSGEYGVCFVCGEEIPTQRLSVDPASTRCMGCVN
ncbi:TraR/DksA C4-type zinc finger protein [bacterium]|nr:TraR/DksA C4-type zinc finger protein [bacterium]